MQLYHAGPQLGRCSASTGQNSPNRCDTRRFQFTSSPTGTFLGGITLFLFGIQVCTGLLLLLYYRPSANEAFESVQYIMTRVQFGWLIRSIHSWAANLMIFTAFCTCSACYSCGRTGSRES